jgi:hypothetical protein
VEKDELEELWGVEDLGLGSLLFLHFPVRYDLCVCFGLVGVGWEKSMAVGGCLALGRDEVV